jgi:CubicO group peptidase (beta-lactamase class C family)
MALLIAFLLLLFTISCGDTELEEGIDKTAHQLENGLVPAVVIGDLPVETFGLHERMEHYRVPGVSIAVFQDYEIAWARGYGLADVAGNIPVTTDTLFQAASISKPVAAVGALELVEEGVLDLNQDVNEKLERWKVPAADFTATKPVTLRGLVTHTAGLTVHGFPGYAPELPLPVLRQILDGEPPANTDPIRVDMEPGAEWRYSGGGYTVMQQLMLDVSEQDFPDLMREVVLGPIGMEHSTYQQPLPEGRHKRAARGYRADGTEVEGGWHVYPEMAAAGLWSTPSDLARFAIELQKSLKGESNRVLSKEMVEQMLTPGLNGWGLGLGIEGEADSARFGHGGSNEGFRCQLVAFREGGKGAAVMTNSDNGDALAQEILLSIARAYGWPGIEPTRKKLVDVDAETLAR